jgi:uncharacterized protein
MHGQVAREVTDQDRAITSSSTGATACVDDFASGPFNTAVRCRSLGEFEQTFGPVALAYPASVGVAHFFENGGAVCWIVRIGGDQRPATAVDYIGNLVDRTGMHALEAAGPFDVLCLPGAAALPALEMRKVYRAALQLAQRRRAFLLIDIPASVSSVSAMRRWTRSNATLRSPDAAVHFPRLVAHDHGSAGGTHSVASSGAIAGLYARIDRSGGVWKAPAGVDAALEVSGLASSITDAELTLLAQLGVNGLRTLPTSRHVVWGARTLDGADDRPSVWRYVPTRRLTLLIQRSLELSLTWVVFEPNDEPLYASLTRITEAYLHTLFVQGAFVGAQPDTAYFVRCGRATTTAADVARGVVNVMVGIAVIRPAEFVMLNIPIATAPP